ncbi:Cys-tRNA(Pro) deacylase [soil metagenome]
MAKRSIGTPATLALDRAQVTFSARAYPHDPRVTSFGLEAAEALGVEPARVFKTLIARLDGDLVVGLVPVTSHLDLKALARALGGSKATMAEVADAERATGYVAGGISPFGQKKAHRTVVDESLLGFATILVSGGRRGLDVEVSPTDLIALTRAVTAPIARPDSSTR